MVEQIYGNDCCASAFVSGPLKCRNAFHFLPSPPLGILSLFLDLHLIMMLPTRKDSLSAVSPNVVY